MSDMPERVYLRDDGSGYGHVELTNHHDQKGCEYIRADLAAERERELINKAARCVPTSWLDSLLTGPDSVNLDGADCRQIEALLRGVQDRIRALAKHTNQETDDE